LRLHRENCMHCLFLNIPGIARIAIAAVCLLLTGAATSSGKEWRGIVPLHSTRADVEKLLGKPAKSVSDRGYFYDLKDEVAVVWFETTGCEGDSLHSVCGWGWNVPRDTVTSIGVVFKNPQPITRVVNIAGFKGEASCEGLIYYENKAEGFEVETYRGKVLSLTYKPTEAESYLSCPVQRERCILSARKLDEYGNIRWADEKARLDNVAVELQNAPDLRLAILAYGGRRSRPDEAIKRAERAKRYLVRVRNINPWQVVAASCGYREDLTVELMPHVKIGAWRIYPAPTVDPSEVKPRTRKKPQ
jgi:hypothetical protein